MREVFVGGNVRRYAIITVRFDGVRNRVLVLIQTNN